MNDFFDFSLGRDFWLYRIGQLLSLLGSSCGGIALAWWVLDKTGSAAKMSAVIAPAMAVRVILLPLMGPLADRFPRKRLILIADLWRFACSAAIAAMVWFDYYDAALLTTLYALSAVGGALFSAAASAIVPQLVERAKLQKGLRQTQAVDSLASVAGGVLGGVMVSFTGVFGAFLADALSFLASSASCAAIRTSTQPAGVEATTSFSRWRADLTGGLRLIRRTPVLLWICVVAMFMNLAGAPLGIVLPVLVKQGRGLPAWFLGGLESSMGLGAIVGAVTVGALLARLRSHRLTIVAIAMMGVGIAILPWVPNVLLPLSVLFWVGVAATWANIPLNTQISLTVPDSHLARVGAIMAFLCGGIAPLGVAGAGLLVSSLGLNAALVLMGVVLVALTPLLLLIPRFGEFMNATPEEAAVFLTRHYPEALTPGVPISPA
jgi:MFS transporter, DHA3 family, macrolide efflux protein